MWWSKQNSRKSAQTSRQSGTSAPKTRAPLMMSLEPRFMFDGAVAASHAEGVHVAIDHGYLTDHIRSLETPAASSAASGPTVIFIDSRVEDPASLLQGVAPGTQVVYLQSNADGLQQMESYLEAHPGAGSVEIIAHGSDGDLLIGDTNLTNANIHSYAQTLSAIGSNLKQGADILVYACDTAADSTGVAFVDSLAQLTGHHVVASTNTTGAAGDWNLEFSTGDITARPVLSAAAEAGYQDNLGLLEVTSSADNGASGTLRYEIANSASGDVIYFETGITTVSMTTGTAFSITHNLTIESDLAGDGASGSQVTINANHLSGVMSITGGNVSLIGLTLENGLIAGSGGGYGTAVNAPTAGGNALGAGLFASGASTVVTLNHVNFTSNDATGGGGAGSGSSATGLGGYNYGGGGGSGFAGVGGGKGGRFNSPTYVYNSVPSSFPGANPANGNGGAAGYAGSSSYAGSGGIGGNPTGAISGHGGAGGAASGGFAAGGAGASAGSGTSAIGGGGGGSGELNGNHGTAGGVAAGGLYVGNGAKVYMANAVFTHNYGAGGGGGGSYVGTAGAGGSASGAILVGATGTLKYQTSTVTFTGNDGVGGSGGGTYTGAGGGTAGANGGSSGTTGISTVTGSTVVSTYVPPTTVTAVTVPSDGTYHDGQALDFTVTFTGSVNVTGTPEIAITLPTGGTVEAVYAGGSGTSTLDFSYTIVAGEQAPSGITVGALSLNGGTIKDSSSNSAVTTFTSVPSTSGVDVQAILPTVSSIDRTGSTPNNTSSESFTVTYSEAMNPSSVLSTDFAAVNSGTVSETGITVSEVSTSVYTVTVNGVTGDGTLGVKLNTGTSEADSYGNVIATGYTSGQTYTVEHTAPSVSSVAVPGDGTYIAGQNLDFTVNFSEAVTVTGTPEIALTLTIGGTVEAQYVSGSGTSALLFRYTVIGGEEDLTGISVGSAITLNSGTIADAATNNAVLTLNSVGSTSGVLVDSIPPDVSSVSVPADGTYGAGEVLTFTVNFSENVLVTTGGGTPYIDLTLTSGGTVHATYTGGSGTDALTFAYTVVSGNADLTGISVGSSIVLNGGTIKDAATNVAVLTLNNVGSTANVDVDAVPPTASSIDITGNPVNNGSSENYLVTFDVPVHGVDASDFSFTTVSGNVTASSISVVPLSSTTYSVTIGGVTGDGVLRLDLTGGDPITDNFGNALVAGRIGDQTYTVNHTPPTITAVTLPTDGTYVSGQDLDFTVTFSEAVTVDTTGGTPRIDIAIDTPSGTTIYANYISGSGSSTLTFRSIVQPGWQDLTGITVVNSGNLDVNGGTIKDAAGNSETNFALTGIGSTANIDIDAIVPTISSVDVPPDGTYGIGQDLDFALNFSKSVTVDTTGGTPYIQFTLTTGGTVDAVYLSGSGTSSLVFRYVIPTGEQDLTGIAVGSSLFTNGGTIQDSVGNNTDTTLNDVGSTANVDVDSTPPTVSSIAFPTGAINPNNASTETYTVTFDKAVSGVDVTDFTVVGTGTASGTVDTVSGSGMTWTVTVGSVTGDGTLQLNLNNSGDAITDTHGNTLTAAFAGSSYTVQHSPPAASSMTVPADGTYGVGQDMNFIVTYDELVTVDTSGGTPRIAITLDTGGTVYATYVSGSGTNALTFRFDPVAGEQDLTGITTATSIDTNGGTIKDAVGNSANLAINTVEPSLANVDVDAIVPVVDSVDVPSSATYITGQDLDFTVNFNKTMTVDTTGGTPYITLTLATGGTVDAAYVSGSGTSNLVFEYVVVAGEAAPSGVVVGSAIHLGGGTIDDAHGNATNLALNSVASTTGVVVDSIPPTVTSIDTVGSTETSATSVQFTVTFSEPVTGVVAGDFTLTDTGGTTGTIASVTAVSGSVYTVTVNGITGLGTMRLDLNSSGTGIADLATNPIATGYTNGEIYTFANPSPVVTSVDVPAAGTYTLGQDLNFEVNYSEVVQVNPADGTPTINVTLGNGEVVHANYVSGSGSSVLTFSYEVAQGDIDTSGIVVGHSISAVAGAISDGSGHTAQLSLNDIGDTSHVLVDGTNPEVTSIGIVGNALTNADSVVYTVHFSEGVTGVNISDFTLTTSGSASGTIASVVGFGGSSFVVTVDNVAGSGTMRLDLNSPSGVSDSLGTPVSGYTAGASYTIDRVTPTVTQVSAPADGTYIVGQNLDFTVTYSAPVTVNASGGEPSLTIVLADGKSAQAQLVSTSGNQLTFQYTVASGDQDLSGIALGRSINLNGATLQDAFGNTADLTLQGTASTAHVDVDGIAPSVTSVAVPAAGVYTPGESLSLVVSFNETVNVNTAGGTPEIAITLDNGTTAFARYASGSGGTALTFSYTVPSSITSISGIQLASTIIANGGSINSSDNNVAALALNQVPSVSQIEVGPASTIAAGAGRGLTVGVDTPTSATTTVNPFVWVVPSGSSANTQGLPTTTQTTWSSVPLLSSGEQESGQVEGSNRGIETAVGSSGFTSSSQTLAEQVVSPGPVEMPALPVDNTDGTSPLQWTPPSDLSSSLQMHDTSAFNDTPTRDTNLMQRTQPVQTPVSEAKVLPTVARHIHVQSHKHVTALPAASHQGHAEPNAGKASLNQQFSRYGKTAWEREKSDLVDQAQRNAQRHTG